MSEWGIPYMGSKSGIAASLALNFPKADHFYDLFGGGFSISHYMIANKSRNYKHFHYNEIKPHIVDVVKRAILGEFNYRKFNPPWISRDEFAAKKLIDGYISTCWSFGNNGEQYLFSREIEPYKRSMHMAVVFGEFDDIARNTLGFTKWPPIAKTIKQRRLYLGQLIEHYRKTRIPQHLHQFLSDKQKETLAACGQIKELKQLQLQQLEQLLRLERLQQLQQLLQLERLERVNFTSKSYSDVDVLPNSIVYCDIPYAGTADYGDYFDHEEFFNWASSRPFPVFISEYYIPDRRFKLVYEINKRCLLTAHGESNKVKVERLYWNGK